MRASRAAFLPGILFACSLGLLSSYLRELGILTRAEALRGFNR